MPGGWIGQFSGTATANFKSTTAGAWQAQSSNRPYNPFGGTGVYIDGWSVKEHRVGVFDQGMKYQALAAVAAGLIWTAGCQHDDTPPPPSASIPPVGTYTDLRGEAPKPLPPQEPPPIGPGGCADEPLVTQAAPEEAGFVDAYSHVGSPRITLFLNRSLQGQIVEPGPGAPISSYEDIRESNGRVESRTRTDVYLQPGEYDEVAAHRIDYDAIETVMTGWLAAGGRVTMVSPTLSQGQVDELQHGNHNVLQQLEKENQIDVLIQVQAKPTRQTPEGLQMRLIAEAINTQGGESIGQAVVDVPPPLDKPQINEYTRYLARKLMSDLTRSWNYPHPSHQMTAAPTTEPLLAAPAPTTAP